MLETIKLGFQEHYKVLTYDKFDIAKSTHSKNIGLS